MSLGRRQLFIYYRLAEAEVPAAVAAVAKVQQGLASRHPGLQCRLLRRPQASEGERTVMETYVLEAAASAEGVDERLQRSIEEEVSHALSRWLSPGARHTEVFEDIPCAS